jgi:ATP phosphoribosyltransferase regulatory subunit
MPVDRPYLAGGRVGEARAQLATLNAALMVLFEAAGAMRVEPAALHPAGALLDVYGEDLRARAFTLEDEAGAELVLRPDFTVPVVQLHLAAHEAPARYSYLGPVWRRQPPGSARPTEYLQAGIEVFGEDAAEADAAVFALMREALALGGVETPAIVTGDLGLIVAMLDAAPMPDHRRAALKRHFWRPARFQALLRRYAAPAQAQSAARAALLADPSRLDAAMRTAGEFVGKRGRAEIAARLDLLRADAEAAPIPAVCADAIEAAFAVEGPAAEAHARLADLARGAGLDITPALDRFAHRLDALAARGENPDALPFRAATARALEYYDGFVFEMAAPGRRDLPPLAGGGRYDGIARGLGASAPLPAVGAMVRPEALMAAGVGPC